MDAENLKKLSTARILNLTRVYRAIGENSSVINVKLRQPYRSLDNERLKSIENKILDSISEIVDIADIDLVRLIPRLFVGMDDKEIISLFENMKTLEVEPIGYIHNDNEILCVFLPKDKYRPRRVDHEGEHRFMPINQIMAMEGNLELTGRGRINIAQATKDEQ